jgi:DNA-binding phage protein
MLACSQGISDLARGSRVNRPGIYKALRKYRDPRFNPLNPGRIRT